MTTQFQKKCLLKIQVITTFIYTALEDLLQIKYKECVDQRITKALK